MYWFFQGKCSRVSVLYTGHVEESGFHVWCGPVSCTMGHYQELMLPSHIPRDLTAT